MSIEYSALESGLERFVKLDKDCDFVGKKALMAWQERGFDNCFATLEVHAVTDADARGSEGLYKDGQLVGRATSGGFGFRTNKSKNDAKQEDANRVVALGKGTRTYTRERWEHDAERDPRQVQAPHLPFWQAS